MTGIARSLDEVFSYRSLVHAIAGATGSVIGLSTFFPLDTIRTRLQVHDGKKKLSTVSMGAQILHEEGVHGLYKGWLPVVSSLCCSNFVYFYVYNSLKTVYRTGTTSPDGGNALQDLLLAFISGVLNVLITTPLWVANTRLKIQGTTSDPTRGKDRPVYKGMSDCIRRILREEGVAALWAGALPSVALAGNPAVQFMVYEALKRYLMITLNTQELSGLAYFLIGAIAKFVATLLTYPLQLIQTRWRAGNHGDAARGRLNFIQTVKNILRHHGLGGLYRGLGAKLSQTVLMAALMFLIYEKIAAFVFHVMGVPHTALLKKN